MISDADADADLLDALEGARTPHGTVDNVLRVHSLRPNSMRGHMALYKAALHDDANHIYFDALTTQLRFDNVKRAIETGKQDNLYDPRRMITSGPGFKGAPKSA